MTEASLYLYGALGLAVGATVFAVASIFILRPYRPLYALMLAVPSIVVVGYFAMSQGIGLIMAHGLEVNITRYVDWLLTTPILLYMLIYTMYSTLSRRRRVFLIVATLNTIMLATGLGAELTDSTLRALLFSVSSLAFLAMLYLIVDGMLKLNLERTDPKLKKTALVMAWIVLILWSIYPFVWMMSPVGLGVLSNQSAITAYLVMDICTKLGFTGALLYFLSVEMRFTQSASHNQK